MHCFVPRDRMCDRSYYVQDECEPSCPPPLCAGSEPRTCYSSFPDYWHPFGYSYEAPTRFVYRDVPVRVNPLTPEECELEVKIVLAVMGGFAVFFGGFFLLAATNRH